MPSDADEYDTLDKADISSLEEYVFVTLLAIFSARKLNLSPLDWCCFDSDAPNEQCDWRDPFS